MLGLDKRINRDGLVLCQRCKGKGGYFTKLRQSKSTPLRFATNDNLPREHYVSCDTPGCECGIVDTNKQHEILWGK